MTPLAIVFLVLSLVIVWGGLLASVLYLNARPESPDLPSGGDDEADSVD